jgi:hypothetical protein
VLRRRKRSCVSLRQNSRCVISKMDYMEYFTRSDSLDHAKIFIPGTNWSLLHSYWHTYQSHHAESNNLRQTGNTPGQVGANETDGGSSHPLVFVWIFAPFSLRFEETCGFIRRWTRNKSCTNLQLKSEVLHSLNKIHT